MAEKFEKKFGHSTIVERYQKDQRFQGQMIRNGYNIDTMYQWEQWKYEKQHKKQQSPFFHNRTASERSHGKRQYQVTRPPHTEIGLEPEGTIPRAACPDYKEMRATADRLTHETRQRGRTLTATEVQEIGVGHQLETFDGNTGEHIRSARDSIADSPWRWDAGASMHPSRTNASVHQLRDVEDALHQQQLRDNRRLSTVWGSWRGMDDVHHGSIDYWSEAEWWQQHAWEEEAGRDALASDSNYQQSKGKSSYDRQRSTFGKGWKHHRY